MTDRYMRVKGKDNKAHFDILIESFDPDKHTAVEKGPMSGTSPYPRRIKYSQSKPAGSKSGEPSGEPKQESED